MIVSFKGGRFVREVKKEQSVVKDLDDITASSAFLIIAGSILQDVACMKYAVIDKNTKMVKRFVWLLDQIIFKPKIND